MNYKEFMEIQPDVRRRFNEVLRDNPQSLRSLAKEIGVAYSTLLRWLRGEINCEYMNLCKFDNWIKSREVK